MKCKILPVSPMSDETLMTVVNVKLHRHTIEIQGLSETDAYELEEILNRATKIKVRRYNATTSKDQR